MVGTHGRLALAAMIAMLISSPASGVPPTPTNNLKLGDLCLSLHNIGPIPKQFETTSAVEIGGAERHTFKADGFGRLEIAFTPTSLSECREAGLEIDSFRGMHRGDRLESRACLSTDKAGEYLDVSLMQFIEELRPPGQGQPRGITAIQFCSISDVPGMFWRQTVRYGPQQLVRRVD